ncbi:hypothetical protein [Streptomyces sp. NPDC096013]|uniref:hypothetical protein n=1 Tax=Streptomyces sp. NPDC096013 TaxID=3366069 RepID=UPI0038124145
MATTGLAACDSDSGSDAKSGTGHDRAKSCPLVLFMHDASLITTTVRATPAP